MSSISFISILFAVTLAVLGVSLKHLKNSPVLSAPLFEAIIAFFYASIAYAVVAGHVRSGRLSMAIRSILWGNVISEWYGVYPLIIVFSPLIGQLSGSSTFCALALAANILGYGVYWLSGISILSRFSSGWQVIVFHVAILAILISCGVAATVRSKSVESVSIIVGLAFCSVLSVLHFRSREGGILSYPE
jgi:hypothetical protein